MRSLPSLGVLAFAGLAALASPASAQVIVRAPFVDVRVGGGVSVRAPFVDVRVGNGVSVRAPFVNLYVPPRRTVRWAPPPRPVRSVRSFEAPPVLAAPRSRPSDAPPVPVEELRTAPVSPARLARPVTPEQFAASFRPVAGTHDVVLEHPRTHRPVKVRFTLPEGEPRKVRVNRFKLEFDYGRHKVTLRFFHNGTVRVRS